MHEHEVKLYSFCFVCILSNQFENNIASVAATCKKTYIEYCIYEYPRKRKHATLTFNNIQLYTYPNQVSVVHLI